MAGSGTDTKGVSTIKFSLQRKISRELSNRHISRMIENIGDLNVLCSSSHLLEDDLRLIRSWAKDDLFPLCKFLYRERDLQPDGKIYKIFQMQCLEKLSGVKAACDDETKKRVYIKILWDLATKKNIVCSALNLRRSGVYTVMINRFSDLCKLCSQLNLIFPAWEAFEARLDNPTTYFLFYDNFLRATEGEEKWKASATNPKSRDPSRPDQTRFMSNSYNESFALILLKNNYFAWLLEAKDTYRSLLTDYDRNIPDHYCTLAEYTMGGICCAIIGENDDDDNQTFVTTMTPSTTQQEDNGSEDDDDEYLRASKAFQVITEEIRKDAQTSAEYAKIQEALEAITVDSGTTDKDEKARKKKKRKLVKGLKQFTGVRVGEEKAYRGWSARTHTNMLDFKREIEKESERYVSFEEEYRRVFATRKANMGTVTSGDNDSAPGEDPDNTIDELFQLPEGCV